MGSGKPWHPPREETYVHSHYPDTDDFDLSSMPDQSEEARAAAMEIARLKDEMVANGESLLAPSEETRAKIGKILLGLGKVAD